MKCVESSTSITVPGRRVHELDGQQQVLARRVQDRDVALEPRVDRGELLQRRLHRLDDRRVAARLGDALEADVALLAQPVERLPGEHDPVLGRRLRERRVNIARPHGTDASLAADRHVRPIARRAARRRRPPRVVPLDRPRARDRHAGARRVEPQARVDRPARRSARAHGARRRRLGRVLLVRGRAARRGARAGRRRAGVERAGLGAGRLRDQGAVRARAARARLAASRTATI